MSTNFPKVKTTVEWKSKRKTNPSSFKFRQNFTADNLEFPWSENSLFAVRSVPMSSSGHTVSCHRTKYVAWFRHFLYIYTHLTGIFCKFRTICLCHNPDSICHNPDTCLMLQSRYWTIMRYNLEGPLNTIYKGLTETISIKGLGHEIEFKFGQKWTVLVINKYCTSTGFWIFKILLWRYVVIVISHAV